jgi:anaerobic dimethyl sulfoxide reductase subunit B (iron-sulfur subunit)
MCDFCLDRWAEGKQPICVAGCPTRALDAGLIEEMEAKYSKTHEAVGFTYDDKLRPSVIFKPKAEVSVSSRQ